MWKEQVIVQGIQSEQVVVDNIDNAARSVAAPHAVCLSIAFHSFVDIADTLKYMQYWYESKNIQSLLWVSSPPPTCSTQAPTLPKPKGVFPIGENASDTDVSCCVLHVWKGNNARRIRSGHCLESIWENGFSVSAPHTSIMFLSFFFSAQDEEQDPLLNSFGHLKEVLNNIKGMWDCGDVCWV